jgi:hypothetical protein
METNNSRRAFVVLMLSVSVILIGFIVIGYVIFNIKGPKVVEEEENGADIILNYSSNESGLKIRNASKTSDENGILTLKEGEYFDFSVEVLLDNASYVEYEISAIKDAVNSTTSNDDIRIYLEKEKDGSYTKVFGPDKFTPLKEASDLGSKKGSMPLINVKKTNSNTDNYRLRMWLSDKSQLDTGTYSIDVEVNGVAK